MRLLPLLVCASLAPLLHGQSTWLVDVANGPGTHFVSLTAAFASSQVADGDVLLVRPGTYAPAATSKALTVLGSPTASITASQSETLPAALAFVNTTSNRPVVLKNLVIQAVGSHVGLDLRSLAGSAHLENIDAATTMYPGAPTISPVQISGCPLVTMQRVRASGGEFSTNVMNSVAFASECEFTGQTANAVANILYGRTQAALSIGAGTFVWLAGTKATGGAGVFLGMYGFEPPAPAIRCGGTLFVSADASSVIAAGAAGPSTIQANAIQCLGTSVAVDPDVTLLPTNGARPISCVATSAQLPALRGAGAPPGSTATLTYVSAPGNSFALWLALPAPPIATPFGWFALDLASLTTVAAGVVPPAGSVTVTLPVPSFALLQGLAVAAQAVDVAAASNPQLSNAAAIVLY